MRIIDTLDADVLLLTGIDWDLDKVALTALADRLEAQGAPYPYRFAPPPNRGLATELDLNGDGRTGTPDDAQGWGRFRGERSMAILSRLPLDDAAVLDLSGTLWRDLPGNIAPPMPPDVAAIQRLSSTGHWAVPVTFADGRRLWLLVWSATPPVFDDEKDRNGRRNHDEAALWLRLLDGALPVPAPTPPFVILGNANLDPADGDGRPQALRALLADQRLHDPAPRGTHGRIEPGQTGDPALDTAQYDPPLGGLRLDYVLPSADLTVTGAGVLWSAQDSPLTDAASHHRPVWVDIDLSD